MGHSSINSYKRNDLWGKFPYECGRFMMPDDFDDFCIYLGLEEIPPTEINLTPGLLQTGPVISIASGN